MKKKIATLLVALLVLFPKTSRADLDVLSIFQDVLKTFQEKMNTVVHTYLGYQINLQELALNGNIVEQLKAQVKNELNARSAAFLGDLKNQAGSAFNEFLNTRLSNVSLPGIASGVNLGEYVSPQLKQQIGLTYFKRQNVQNDVQVTVATDLKNNNLLVENLAIIFANGLVNRKKLMDEAASIKEEDDKQEKDDKESNPDVNTVKWRYGEALRRANHRWLEIMSFEAAYRKTLSEMLMTGGRIDDISEIISEDEQKAMENMANNPNQQGNPLNTNNPLGGINPADLGNIGKNILNDIKNGNYSNAFNNAAGLYSNSAGSREGVNNVLGQVSTGLGSAQNAYNNAASGNIGGAVGAAAGGAGTLSGSEAVAGAAGGAGSALNSALSGDWNKAISGGAATAGGAVGGTTGNEVGALGSIAGGAAGVATQGGNLEQIIGNTANNSGIRNGINALGNGNQNAGQGSAQGSGNDASANSNGSSTGGTSTGTNSTGQSGTDATGSAGSSNRHSSPASGTEDK